MEKDTRSARRFALDLAVLRGRLDGRIVLPEEPEWDEARSAWNLAVDQRPSAVVLPESSEDVAATVRFAARNGLRVAMQGTGHNAGPLGPLGGTILVRTSELRGVRIDPVARTARVEAGALWADVAGAAGRHGLAALAGSSPDVGVVGYTLGGGLSWLGRKHGLAANSVVSAEVVTADGALRLVDAEHDHDLFWALRGGGGSFAAVTALEFRLFELDEVYAGMLVWPMTDAPRVLQAWREWTATAPDEATTSARLLRVPPLPDIPEAFRGRELVVIDGAIVADAASGVELLAPLRALMPEVDTFGMLPSSALSTIHMDPDHPVPGHGDGFLLAELPAEAVDALIEAGTPEGGSPLLAIEVRHLGGALGVEQPHHGALAALPGAYAFFAVGICPTPEVREAIEGHLDAFTTALALWTEGRSYLNFAERRRDAGSFFAPERHARLRTVKATYDPHDLFRANHPVVADAQDELAAA
jgi:FAD/FMN-containing dehydrogenase